MVTPDTATRLLCRIMLAVWLLLVCCMTVAALGGGASTGNLLALMFTGNVPRPPVMPPPASPPAPEPAPVPAPTPAPEPQPAPAEASVWRELPRGKRPGKGRLFPPRVETRRDGSLALFFPYEGNLGEYTLITPANVTSRSVDLHGQWSAQVTLDTRPAEGCVRRLQIAAHPGWIRVSAVARDGGAPQVDVRCTDKELRIIFSAQSSR
ncbi:hypothetical protein [uncultured Desulfovibrio sp.]|uniref:hypothetical protein n=2 Tax=uncultured Desulfovibrio sp. TaxID=167968 RepID=UPI00320B9033